MFKILTLKISCNKLFKLKKAKKETRFAGLLKGDSKPCLKKLYRSTCKSVLILHPVSDITQDELGPPEPSIDEIPEMIKKILEFIS